MSSGRRYHHNLAATNWQPAAPEIAPLPGEVHVWRIRLETGEDTLRHNARLLAPDEQQRAAKFHFQQDRDHFVLARGALRQLLGAYLAQPAAGLVFRYHQYGKPALADNNPLSFNLSHAGGYALVAVTHQAAVGVDLELTDENIEIARLAARFFSSTEAHQVLRLPTAARPAAFFRTWTRKEAFLKAHGQGLSLPLDQFAVTVDLRAPLQLEEIAWAPGTEGDWSLASFMALEGLPGALVLEGRLEVVRYCDFSWE